jgi:hypothetical protein
MSSVFTAKLPNFTRKKSMPNRIEMKRNESSRIENVEKVWPNEFRFVSVRTELELKEHFLLEIHWI